MVAINTWVLTEMGFADEYDKAKDIVIEKLVGDGLLEKDTGELWAASHTFVVKEPNRISKWISRIFKGDTDKYNVFLVTIECGKNEAEE